MAGAGVFNFEETLCIGTYHFEPGGPLCAQTADHPLGTRSQVNKSRCKQVLTYVITALMETPSIPPTLSTSSDLLPRRWDVFGSSGWHCGTLLDWSWQTVGNVIGPRLRAAFEACASGCVHANPAARSIGTLAGSSSGYVDAGWGVVPGSHHALEGLEFREGSSRVPFWKATNNKCEKLISDLELVTSHLGDLLAASAPDILESLEEPSARSRSEHVYAMAQALSFPQPATSSGRHLHSHQVAVRVRSSEDECTDLHHDIKNADRRFGHVSAYSTTGGVAAGQAVPEFTNLVIIPRAGGGRESCRFVTTEEGRLRVLLMHTQYDLHTGTIDTDQPRARERQAAEGPQCTAIIFYAHAAMDNLLARIDSSADPLACVREIFHVAQERATAPEHRCCALRDTLLRHFPDVLLHRPTGPETTI